MGEIFLNEQPYFYEIILQFSFLYRDKHFLHQSSYRPENKWQKCEGLDLKFFSKSETKIWLALPLLLKNLSITSCDARMAKVSDEKPYTQSCPCWKVQNLLNM